MLGIRKTRALSWSCNSPMVPRLYYRNSKSGHKRTETLHGFLFKRFLFKREERQGKISRVQLQLMHLNYATNELQIMGISHGLPKIISQFFINNISNFCRQNSSDLWTQSLNHKYKKTRTKLLTLTISNIHVINVIQQYCECIPYFIWQRFTKPYATHSL